MKRRLSNERKEKDIVNVKIESKNKNYEYKYSLNEIKVIGKHLTTSNDFFLKFKSKEYDKMYDDFIDKNIITKEAFNGFINETVLKNEKIFGEINAIELNGFNISTVNNMDIIEIISSSKLPKGTLRFSTRFLKNGNGKIAGFYVN